ncbi:MAG: PEP/pyruvate-binding domain-containing protein [Pseudomonadota bacterium]
MAEYSKQNKAIKSDAGALLREAVVSLLKKKKPVYEQYYTLESGFGLAVAITADTDQYCIFWVSDDDASMLMHWGIAPLRHEWILPPSSLLPKETSIFENKAAQTLFFRKKNLQLINITVSKALAPKGILFVLKRLPTGQWIKDNGRNFYIPISSANEYEGELGDVRFANIADEIITHEMGSGSWTLMHRFDLCYDLLDKVPDNGFDGLALLFVWLRFSALRQLDWQRNYNTKPKELAHAQDRLTHKLAARFARNSIERPLLRMLLATLGRGANGQRVRDEILHIMHNHHIKEISGHFMEEWHQKLHNNTTPDDVVICEAYLAFLRSNGDLGLFYKTLKLGGVSEERLKGYDRPIISPPDFIPYLKEALISDFERFLRILKAVHSGTDLETAIDAVKGSLKPQALGSVEFVLYHQNDLQAPLAMLAEKIAAARAHLVFEANRDFLLLDIALEHFLRILVERRISSATSERDLFQTLKVVLENLTFSLLPENTELDCSLKHWKRLVTEQIPEPELTMHARSVLDRISRILEGFIDYCHNIFQPKAELLGKAFKADSWTLKLFSEEVVRGHPISALSMLVSHINAHAGKNSGLGRWQIISRKNVAGVVEYFDSLRPIQEKKFSLPTILIIKKVFGDEEVPEGAVGMITLCNIDLVSHIAIRARNAGILCATSHDSSLFDQLKGYAGKRIGLQVDDSGDISFSDAVEEPDIECNKKKERHVVFAGSTLFSTYAIPEELFSLTKVGGKSVNIAELRKRLPQWLQTPRSVALPFGVLEHIMEESVNRSLLEQYKNLISALQKKKAESQNGLLAQLRSTILALNAPADFYSSLCSVMTKAQLALPSDCSNAWTCIKQVWASKWNLRAYVSRRRFRIRHNDLIMAVLIQEVVEADYSFVIHTSSPVNRDANELYGEVVIGLGETLVGNYSGSALRFTCRKKSNTPKLLALPSKSFGLFGSGLIFRSDSNAEDLSGYAGAGLYDSVMSSPPEKVCLDYSQEPIFWDKALRTQLLSDIANIGEVVEKIMGSPQDIEGVVSKGKCYVVQTRPQV